MALTPPKLVVELVPKSAWGDNLRSRLPAGAWDKLRLQSYRLADHKCELCGGVGSKHPVECHEVWQYDDVNHIQSLIRLISLCPACHEVKHFGLAQVRGRDKIALAHLMKVNSWTQTEASVHVRQAFSLWSQRSKHTWELDLTKLQEIQN